MASKKKQMKQTGGKKYLVRVMGMLPEVSTKKMRARLEELTEDTVIFSQQQPRSSKRIARMIPKSEFIVFNYNEKSGSFSFMLAPQMTEIMSVVGKVKVRDGYVIVEEADGTVHTFRVNDCIIEAAAGESEKKKKRRDEEDEEDEAPKPKKKRQVIEDDDDEDEDDSDDDDSEDEEDEDDDSDSDEDEDDSDDDEDSDEDDDDEDSDEDEDDSDDEEDEDDSDEDDEEDDEDEDDEPRSRGKGKGRRR